jgi:choline monooxygenase
LTALEPFEVDEDPRRAATPPASFYTDPARHAQLLERVFARSWSWIGDEDAVPRPVGSAPATLFPGSLAEPLVLTREEGRLRCFSNVCTHRGMELCAAPSTAAGLRCRYHGRRFDLDGRFRSAPGFEGAADFPREADSLRELPLERRGPWLFSALEPDRNFDSLFAPVAARCGHLPWDRLERDRNLDRSFEFDAHWALYVENYLEGLHIPFLHPGLNQNLDWSSYGYELQPSGTLQLGFAGADQPAFAPTPAGHPDHGRRVAAWYWWWFPSTMVNVYPWGVSLNLVEPLGPGRTRVRFLAYLWDRSLLGRGAGGDLLAVELEDEGAVSSVQRGLRSRLYPGGRYAPDHERGTHHFHRLLARALAS